MSVNSFSDADFRCMSASDLSTLAASTLTAINLRLTGTSPETAESYNINGKAETRTPLEFLFAMLNAIRRAQQLQTYEPSGIGITRIRSNQATGDGGSCWGRGGWGR